MSSRVMPAKAGIQGSREQCPTQAWPPELSEARTRKPHKRPSARLGGRFAFDYGKWGCSRLARASNPGYALCYGSKDDRLGTSVSAGEVWQRRRSDGDRLVA